VPEDYFISHCGGLVFGADGMLYYVSARWPHGYPREHESFKIADHPRKIRAVEGVLWRMDPATLKREEAAVLERPDACSHYVSRGSIDHNGDLFFGHIGPTPVGFFKVTMPPDRKRADAHLPLRVWG